MTENHNAATDAPGYALRNIPDDFWERDNHKHIRDAAHARLVSADLVLHAVLARIAAMRSHELVFDSGRGRSSLNHFVAVVGASGVGKSTGAAVGNEVLVVPDYLSKQGELVRFADGLPIGSGEGLAEMFMGVEAEEDTTRDGKPMTRKVRKQVRHNAFVCVDEGEVFTRQGERKGSTVGATLRSAWSGATLGSSNGREETTRVVPERSYSLGLVVGFQPSTALPLLQDTATGMAQRFAWVSAVDPSIGDESLEWPEMLQLPALTKKTDFGDDVYEGTIAFPDGIKDELKASHLAKVRGTTIVAEQDSQGPLMRCKLAALLALLAGRHDAVNEEDWRLAGILWDTSCAVRDAVTDAAAWQRARQSELVAQARVQFAERQAAAVTGVTAKVDRLAANLAGRVVEHGGLLHSVARKGLRSDERHLFDAVVERAAELGLLRVTDGGGLIPPLVEQGKQSKRDAA